MLHSTPLAGGLRLGAKPRKTWPDSRLNPLPV